MPANEILLFIMPCYILVTYTMALLFLKRNKPDNRILLCILGISVATELLAALLANYKLVYSVSFLAHHSLWLYLLSRKVLTKKAMMLLLIAFIVFSLINLIYIQSPYEMNSYTFVCGAFVYLIIFIHESFHQLKKENFSFFLSNQYLLLLSPVLFFIGFSFTFAFNSIDLMKIPIVGIKLHYFVGHVINLVYYTLLNIYIYSDKHLANA